MKKTHWLFATLTICILASAGCKKETGEAPGPIPVYYGVKMTALPEVEKEFATAGQDLQASVAMAKRFLRYAQFPQTLAQLGKLANNPNLSESQKKAVNDLIEQVKQVVANTKATPGQ